jgi:biopolymer transport protein ExbD
MARRKPRMEAEEEAEVPMSPLIDCVFLLLIFFLVTTMIKRKDKLIPIQLPDMSSAVSQVSKGETTILGLKKGKLYSEGQKITSQNHKKLGEIKYTPIADLKEWLDKKTQKDSGKFLDTPLRIDADRNVSFQEAIDMIDLLKIYGFSDVGIKTKQRAIEP